METGLSRLLDQMEQVTLQGEDMSTLADLPIPSPIDGTLPRWVKEKDYPNKHHDMLEDLYGANWWAEAVQLRDRSGKAKPENISPSEWLEHVLTDFNGDRESLLRRIGSTAMQGAAAQADVLKGDFETVFYLAAWNISLKRLWTSGKQEYDSFEEYLVDALPRLMDANNKSELSDVLFMMQHLLPIMRNVGGDFEPESLMEFPQHWARARRAVPYLRTKVRMVQDSSEEVSARTEKGQRILEEFHRAVDNVVKVIMDPDIPAEGPRGVTRTLFSMDEGGERPEPVEGFEALLTEGRTLFFFVGPASWERAIESALGSMVAFEAIDPEVGFQEIDHLLHPKGSKVGPDGKRHEHPLQSSKVG